MMSLDTLPDEVLVKIMAACCTRRRLSFRKASRRLNAVFFDPALWRSLEKDFNRLRHTAHLPLAVFGRIIDVAGHHIRRLKLVAADDRLVSAMTQRCRNMDALELIDIDQKFAGRFLERLVTSEPLLKLRRLDIVIQTPKRFEIVIPEPFDAPLALLHHAAPRLQELHFMSDSPLSPHAVLHLLAHLPRLSRLSLSSCAAWTDEHLRALAAMPVAPHLRYLMLGDAHRITDEGIAWFAGAMLGLEVLVLHGCHATDRGLDALVRQLPALLWVKVVGCPLITFGALDRAGFENIIGCPVVHRTRKPGSIGIGFKRS
ncbi:hypothetical protein HDU96_003304 [Phlyctochytrium bullatum]|nr:hypothetical protein HDU96_003304 [Phlyctochytrium bullatum]